MQFQCNWDSIVSLQPMLHSRPWCDSNLRIYFFAAHRDWILNGRNPPPPPAPILVEHAKEEVEAAVVVVKGAAEQVNAQGFGGL